MKEWACKKFYTSKRLTRALEIVSGPSVELNSRGMHRLIRKLEILLATWVANAKNI